jgi:hypothetical protein
VRSSGLKPIEYYGSKRYTKDVVKSEIISITDDLHLRLSFTGY